MTLRASGRAVSPAVPAPTICTARARLVTTQTVRIALSSCCTKSVKLCIPQGATRTFRFQDADTVDFSGAQEITFDAWTREDAGGSGLYSGSMTGGEISLPVDNAFQFEIGNTESAALPAGSWFHEAWVTDNTGARYLVAKGRFVVLDTRKHD